MSGWPAVESWLRVQCGDWSLLVATADGTVVYQYQSAVVRPAASLIKLAIALTIDRYVEQGSFGLDDQVELREDLRVEGEGSVDRAPAASRWNYCQLLEHMLHESDNTAANLLIGVLEQHSYGMDAVNGVAASFGATQTRLQRRFMDFAARAAGHDNLTTAQDMIRLLRVLWQSERPVLRHLFGQLIDSEGAGKLPAGVPNRVQVAHKTGNLPEVEHDVGVVLLPDHPYMVAVLGVGVPDEASGIRIISQLSRRIYGEMAGGHHD